MKRWRYTATFVEITEDGSGDYHRVTGYALTRRKADQAIGRAFARLDGDVYVLGCHVWRP